MSSLCFSYDLWPRSTIFTEDNAINVVGTSRNKKLLILVIPLRVLKLHGYMAGFTTLVGSQGVYGGKLDTPQALSPQETMLFLLNAAQRVAWTQHISAFHSRPGDHFAEPTEASHEHLSNFFLPSKMEWGKQPIAVSLTKLCCDAPRSVHCCDQMRHYPVTEGQPLQGDDIFSLHHR